MHLWLRLEGQFEVVGLKVGAEGEEGRPETEE